MAQPAKTLAADEPGLILSAAGDDVDVQAREKQAQIARAEEAQAALRKARRKQEAQARERRRIAEQAADAQRFQAAQLTGNRIAGMRTLVATDGRVVQVPDMVWVGIQ